MSLDQKVLFTCGLLLVGGVAFAEASTLASTTIASYMEYKKQMREYMAYTQKEREFRCLVRPSYWGIFNGQVKEIHNITFSHKNQPTNYNNFQ